MAGGDGNDTYVVDVGGDVVTENSGEGDDLVRTTVSYTLGANIESPVLLGAGNIKATGNSAANVLRATRATTRSTAAPATTT